MITVNEETTMVYEEREEMELAEQDRLYQQDPMEEPDFNDTFREQLGENDLDDESSLSEDEATTDSAPASDMDEAQFGERVTHTNKETALNEDPDIETSDDALED